MFLRSFLFKKRTVLFYRNFQSFQGGHLKTWNYFEHIKNIKGFTPQIYFSETSVWENNPWLGNSNPVHSWEPLSADVLFLAGLDWSALDGISLNPDKPIINLIQAIRHADPQDVRYKYLNNRAIRICVSAEIASAIKATNQVNGPIFTIPNGIDHALMKQLLINNHNHKDDVFIAGLKNKKLALQLCSKLKTLGINVTCQVENTSRRIFLEKIVNAKVTVLLPAKTEGFFLPALEAMALKSFVVCPDCIGNRDYCYDSVNCLMPDYEFFSLIDTTLKALEYNTFEYSNIINNAFLMAQKYSTVNERKKFTNIMENLDQVWKS